MSYSCLDCGQIFETLDELQNHDCGVAEMEIGHEHSWVPYELEPRHQVNIDVADQPYIDTSRVTAFYVSKVKCVGCGEERDLETPKGDVERQLELQREIGGENVG